jgi:hypothetical protein
MSSWSLWNPQEEEDCKRFEACRSRDEEGAFLVKTSFLVRQGSTTLSGCSNVDQGECQVLDTTGKKSDCLVSLSLLSSIYFALTCSCICLLICSLGPLHASVISWLGLILDSVISSRQS